VRSRKIPSQEIAEKTHPHLAFGFRRLGLIQVATPVALLHDDLATFKINVLPLKPEQFADSQRAKKSDHHHQANVLT
jgi:hypothetical protein